MSRWNSIALFGLFLFAGSLLVLELLIFPPQEPLAPPEIRDKPSETHRSASDHSSLLVTDQDAGVRFFVQGIQTDRASWVVVYPQNSPESLGAFFFPQYNGIQSGGGILQQPLKSGERYRAVLYGDDGDMSFHPENDPPISDGTGRPIQAEFYAR
ncbi:MAG: hypothetical protein RL681_363 [Candidatus Parcubacteria bacterium]|jgi:hypothetical protein